MITAHAEKHCTLWDGETEHAVGYDDFEWTHVGGLNPGITGNHQCHLRVSPRLDLSGFPMQPIDVTLPHPFIEGKTITAQHLPINAYLQAFYGPDKQIVTVPINGDAGAQRLHWIKRTPEERQEMKAILKCMNAWRLTEEGEMPGEGDRVVHGHIDHQAILEAATKAQQKGNS